MRTFCASRHMDSVECVTAQVRVSQSRGGEMKFGGASETYCEGARREIVVGGVTDEGGWASQAIVRVDEKGTFRLYQRWRLAGDECYYVVKAAFEGRRG